MKCRIVMTHLCNLDCSYCCMKDKETRESFKSAPLLYVAMRHHDEYMITGGEPLEDLPRLVQTISVIRSFNRLAKIYVYTNGIRLTTSIADTIRLAGADGLNIGVHGQTWRNRAAIWLIHKFHLPVRFLVGSHEKPEGIEEFCIDNEIPLRVWELGDCYDMEEEARYDVSGRISEDPYGVMPGKRFPY